MNIELYENTRTGAGGFSTPGMAPRVFSNGRMVHNNGVFELVEEVQLGEWNAAEEVLSDGDYTELLERVCFLRDQQTERAKQRAKDRTALDAQKVIDDAARVERARATHAWLSDSNDHGREKIGRHTFVRDHRGLLKAFYKKGGYREWLAPVSREDALAIVAGTKELRYIKRSNRYRLKDL